MPFGALLTGGVTANSSWRFAQTVPAAFSAVRCFLFNQDTANAQTNSKASFSPSESFANSSQPTIGGVIDNSKWGQFTFGGAPTVDQPAAAVAGVPRITPSDWMPGASIARSDIAGGYPAIYTTIYNTTGIAVGYAQAGATSSFLETLAGNKHHFAGYTQGGDAVATPGSFTTGVTSNFIPMGLEFRFDTPVITGLSAGDSTMEGTGNTANTGCCQMASSYLDGMGYAVNIFNMAQSGHTAAKYYARIQAMLALTTPKFIYHQIWSPNDSASYVTDATAAQQRVTNLVAYCTTNKIDLIIDTPQPRVTSGGAAISAGELTAYNTIRNFALNLAATNPRIKCLDWEPMHDAVNKGVWGVTYGSDNFHPNPAGHAFKGQALANAVAALYPA